MLFSHRSVGVVAFLGTVQFQRSFSLMITLNIIGKVEWDGVMMDTDHCYHSQKDEKNQKNTLKVHEGSKLVMLHVAKIVIGI